MTLYTIDWSQFFTALLGLLMITFTLGWYVRGTNRHKIWHVALKKDGRHRFIFRVNHDLRHDRYTEFQQDIVWAKPKLGPGFNIHFGNMSSETPIDVFLGLRWVSFFWSINSNLMRYFATWIGRGHKRNLGVHFHHGKMWWELWYDDDHGWDNWLPNSKWRHGSIYLNPLNQIWGTRKFSYKNIARIPVTIRIGEFQGDFYRVQFTLQHQSRERKRGPKWARQHEDMGYVVEWNAKDGIPFQNDRRGNDKIYVSAFKVEDPNKAENFGSWLGNAVTQLVDKIKMDRIKSGYMPPVNKRPKLARKS